MGIVNAVRLHCTSTALSGHGTDRMAEMGREPHPNNKKRGPPEPDDLRAEFGLHPRDFGLSVEVASSHPAGRDALEGRGLRGGPSSG